MKNIFQKCRGMQGWQCQKPQKLSRGMAVCRQDRAYKDYTSNSIPTFFENSCLKEISVLAKCPPEKLTARAFVSYDGFPMYAHYGQVGAIPTQSIDPLIQLPYTLYMQECVHWKAFLIHERSCSKLSGPLAILFQRFSTQDTPQVAKMHLQTYCQETGKVVNYFSSPFCHVTLSTCAARMYVRT